MMLFLWRITLFLLKCFPIPLLRQRAAWEEESNRDEVLKEKSFKASYAFQFSSEGELEQMRPWIEEFLGQGECLEILYTSPSVQKKVLQWRSTYKKSQLSILALPLVSDKPRLEQWVSAPNLIMCRYDLFPELLMLARRRNSVLLSATLKSSWFLSRWYKRWAYKQFSQVVAASAADVLQLQGILKQGQLAGWADGRVSSISQRLDGARAKLLRSSPLLPLLEIIDSVQRNRRWILGNFWPHEAKIFSNETFLRQIASGELLVTLVPHRLEKESLVQALHESAPDLRLYFIEADAVFPMQDFRARPGVVIVLLKGLLLELYTLFDLCMVGGGHGQSAHSILEPFMAQNKIVVGPRIHRSTEFTLVNKVFPQGIKIFPTLAQFYAVASSLQHEDLLGQQAEIIRCLKEENQARWKELRRSLAHLST